MFSYFLVLLAAGSRENILLYVKIIFVSYKISNENFPKKLPCLHYTNVTQNRCATNR